MSSLPRPKRPLRLSRILRGEILYKPRLFSTMSIREVLARNLRRYRAERGLSQEELAHRAGIDRTYISSLERMQYGASIDVVESLARRCWSIAPHELLRPEE